MTKKFVPFLLLLMISCHNLSAQNEFPLVADIGLIKSQKDNSLTPPSKLVIGIELMNEAYYKLSDRENILKAGLFQSGLNTISIEAYELFTNTGSHVYFLDLKSGDLIVRKEIEIDVQLNSQDNIERKVSQVKIPEYSLSMYVEDKLIISRKKLLPQNISLNIENLPWPGKFNPFGPVDTIEMPLNSFSVLDAVGAAYDLIKKLIKDKKKERRSSPVQKQRQITVTFLRKKSEGVAEEVKAVIKLRTRD